MATTVRSDFEVFQPAGTKTLVAYTTYDRELLVAIHRTTAKFGNRNGRKAWTIDSDSRTVPAFRAAMAAAAERAATKVTNVRWTGALEHYDDANTKAYFDSMGRGW